MEITNALEKKIVSLSFELFNDILSQLLCPSCKLNTIKLSFTNDESTSKPLIQAECTSCDKKINCIKNNQKVQLLSQDSEVSYL